MTTSREIAAAAAPVRPSHPIKVGGRVTTLKALALAGALVFEAVPVGRGFRYFAHLKADKDTKWEVSEYVFDAYGKGKRGRPRRRTPGHPD